MKPVLQLEASGIYNSNCIVYCRDLIEKECIDVTIPLQALVKESKLISPEKNTKVSTPKPLGLV